jgi:PKD repeat protein
MPILTFRTSLIGAALCCTFLLFAQPTFTANQTVPTSGGTFRLGYNNGFSQGWSEKMTADIAAGPNGVGTKTVRQGLFYELLTSYNYEIRLPEVHHYEALGMSNMTALILGGANGGTQYAPPDAVRDNTNYCPTQPAETSELFANMYLPIWDNGANGTPYTDDNHFAAFMYKTVTTYKDYIKFWEVWNEPGFDDTGAKGYLKPGEVGNWWESDPDPCDLRMKAPVQHYVRMLRIAYEVVKTLDPNAYVCMGAPGYPSFVDAVLRNTDNPYGGTVTFDYPLKGGAYFDCLAYHSYPHIDGSTVLSYWPTIDLLRNSDKAAEGVLSLRDRMEVPMISRGYDGITYPRKKFNITEINVPRRPFFFQTSFGTDEIQRNFLIKSFINLKKSDIPQAHIYGLSETKTEADAFFEFHLMGLYKNIDYLSASQIVKTEAGIAARTTSDLLSNCAYDAARSALLAAPTSVRAEAFVRPDGKYVYVLWAKTLLDNTEIASANYSFPTTLSVSNSLTKHTWNWSQNLQTTISTNSNIALTGAPIFLLDNAVPANTTDFKSNNNVGCVPLTVQFTNTSTPVSTVLWSFPGGAPSTSTEQNPSVTYAFSGTYDVSLTSNNKTQIKAGHIVAKKLPTSDYTYLVNGLSVTFYNGATLSNSYLWDFGDGQTSTEENPTHTYINGGSITVKLTATNSCGSVTHSETLALQVLPIADFAVNIQHGCIPFTVQYSSALSQNSLTYSWAFPNGTPSSSTSPNPIVTYNEVGNFNVFMSVANAVGSDAKTKANYILVEDQPVADFTANTLGNTATFANNSMGGTSFTWDFDDGQYSAAQSPVHTYAQDGVYNVKLTISNLCGSSTKTRQVTIVTTPIANFTADVQMGCIPFTVHYNNTSQASMATYQWSFPGGTPTTSTLKNPIITYQQPGTYSAILTVVNGGGSDFEKKDNFVSVGLLPTANFSKQVVGQNTTFTNFSSNADTYLWNFGDGQSSTLANPTHFYATDGVYTAVLTVTNQCGTVFYNEQVVITTPPQAGFTANMTIGCKPLVVQYQNTSVASGASYSWSFPDGIPSYSTDPNPIVTYDHDGLFNVLLTVSNTVGNDTELKTNYINVGGQPFVGFYSVSSGLSVQFNNASVSSSNFQWNFGDGGTSTQANPTHLYSSFGAYDVTLTAISDCGTTVFTQTIVVSALPQAAFTVQNTYGCAPYSVQFQNQSSSTATSYLWYFPGGIPASSTLENPTVSYPTAGMYDVALSVSNDAGVGEVLRAGFISVGAAPQAAFSQVVYGGNVTFQNISVGANSAWWDFGDGQYSSGYSPNHTYTSDGIYVVKLTVNNACGSVTATQNLQIVTTPTANFTSNTSVACAPKSVQFTDASSSNALAWSWSFPGGTPVQSNLRNPSVYYAQGGTYPVTLTVSNASGNNTMTIANPLVINPLPVSLFSIDASGNGMVIFSNLSQHTTSSGWSFGDGTLSQEENPTHTYTNNGTYTVSLQSVNGCGITVSQQIVQISNLPVKATEIASNSFDFKVYPNPSDGNFNVEITNALGKKSGHLVVIDALGRLVLEKELNLSIDSFTYEVEGISFSEGVYRVALIIDGKWVSRSLVLIK